tara:strand:+ start:499 stop:669 length:171 start_codon:yes stop_codon:yes gene_type:complete
MSRLIQPNSPLDIELTIQYLKSQIKKNKPRTFIFDLVKYKQDIQILRYLRKMRKKQ